MVRFFLSGRYPKILPELSEISRKPHIQTAQVVLILLLLNDREMVWYDANDLLQEHFIKKLSDGAN